jgi:hypothetical protein
MLSTAERKYKQLTSMVVHVPTKTFQAYTISRIKGHSL